ncbi:MAG: 23S rRNA (adenine(2503)-C(2))-methyltransferase RlmN [Verrucomicrobiota bacterium]
MLTDIRSQTAEELEIQFRDWGQPTYRAKQLLEWLYVQRATSWDDMRNLPAALRSRLREEYSLSALELIRPQGSPDTTRKFLWRLDDRSLIESVLIPASPALYGDPSDRHTLCISTQVGCAYGCKFCASGLAGWKRNLRVEEIVNQVLAVERWHLARGEGDSPESAVHSPQSTVLSQQSTVHGPQAAGDSREAGGVVPDHASRITHHAPTRLISNLVIMGMGEPLANYDNLLKALRILNAPWGGGIGARKITISTSGLAPQIGRLAGEPLQFRLAISLHGATDAVRNKIMPVNRKHPLAELIAACEYYQKSRGRMITFEYILISGINDGLDQVKPLAALARRLNARVNLIPYNVVEGLPWVRPAEPVQEAFLRALEKEKVAATLRREKGHDIDAACGQLRLKTERELANLPS